MTGTSICDRTRLLWAKTEPFHPLWCHLIDVAVVAHLLSARFGGIPQLPDGFTAFLAGLHDLGKADEWFQNKAESSEIVERLRQNGVPIPSRDRAEFDGQRRFRHEARSAEWVMTWLRMNGWGREAVAVIGAAIHGHHGQFTTEFIYDEDETSRTRWNVLRTELVELLSGVLNPPDCRLDRFDNASEVGGKLSGLIVLADWIASNNQVYRYDMLPQTAEPATYAACAEAEAQAALLRLQFEQPVAQELSDRLGSPTFTEVWPEAKNWNLRPVQRVLEEACQNGGLQPGLVIIEAPMGDGKTEAAIYLAECWNHRTHRSGCYLALPTQATANQIHKRYAKFLFNRRPGSSAPRLVHGMSWLIDEVAPERIPQTFADGMSPEQLARDWFRPARRALLATDGVGTVDQALMAALNVKFGFLRLLGLSAKTLIIDEVHAYDDFMTTIMERLLAWCRTLQIPVILLSATLSQEQKRTLCRAYAGDDPSDEISNVFNRWSADQEPYPLITSVPLSGVAGVKSAEAGIDGTLENRTAVVAVQLHPGMLDCPEDSAALAVRSILNGGCVCVLANTVKSAQAIFQCLLNLQQDGSLNDTELMLFHARFPATRRNKIEEAVTRRFGKDVGDNRPFRAVVVATQVVEQSLDVDFDVMLSQIAPIDLLLQRSGRVWRHNRPQSERHGIGGPALHVLTPPQSELKFGATECVYEREILLRTLSLLHEYPEFQLPNDFRKLIAGCYGTGALPNDIVPEDELLTAVEQRQNHRAEAKALAKTHLLPTPLPRNFRPCRESSDESEGEAHSYFRAQTRMGDDSISVLMLEDDELLTYARSSCNPDAKVPFLDVLKRIFLQKVGLPRWWLFTTLFKPKRTLPCLPSEGFSEFFDGGTWLRNQLVVPLRGGQWRGLDFQGRQFVIDNHPVLGVSRQLLDIESEDLNGSTQDEADAGQLG